VCDDGNQCTIDTCDPMMSGNPSIGCYFDADAANGMPCDDGDPGTTGETCQAGVCSVSCDYCCSSTTMQCPIDAYCSSQPCFATGDVACEPLYCENP
jgi:hypothetical protein